MIGNQYEGLQKMIVCPPITPHPPRESLQSLQIDIFNQMIIKHFDEDRHSSIFILHVFKT